VTPFYVCGGLLAGWALLLSALGITQEGFPGSAGSARVVGGISLLLVAAAVGTGIYFSAVHDDEEHEEEAAVLVRPA
jgi:hypothetical protein